MLEQLMKEYLHITEETNSETENNNTDESDTKSCESDSTLKFIQNNVSKDVSNEDIEEYQDFMDSYVNIDSELYKQCSMALMALTAYAYKCDRDVELGKWIENCQSRKWQNLSPSQEVNFKYMKRSFDNFINANGGSRLMDITMCTSQSCQNREQCYRAMAKPDKYQSYADFTKLCAEKRLSVYVGN